MGPLIHYCLLCCVIPHIVLFSTSTLHFKLFCLLWLVAILLLLLCLPIPWYQGGNRFQEFYLPSTGVWSSGLMHLTAANRVFISYKISQQSQSKRKSITNQIRDSSNVKDLVSNIGLCGILRTVYWWLVEKLIELSTLVVQASKSFLFDLYQLVIKQVMQ